MVTNTKYVRVWTVIDLSLRYLFACFLLEPFYSSFAIRMHFRRAIGRLASYLILFKRDILGACHALIG